MRNSVEKNGKVKDPSYRTILEVFPEPVILYDREGRTTFINSAFTDIFGRTLDELRNRQNDDGRDSADPVTQRVLAKLKRGERISNLKTHWFTRDKKRIDFSMSAAPWRDQDGNPAGYLAHFRDITEQTSSGNVFPENDVQYKLHWLIVEFLPVSIVVYDMEGRAIFLNPAFEKTFGWNHEEILHKKIDFVPPDEMEATGKRVGRMMKGDHIKYFATKRLTKDGRILDIVLNTASFYNDRGEQIGNVVILRDVTELRKSRMALEKSEESYRTLFNGVPVGLYRAKTNGVVEDVNHGLVAMLGYPDRQSLIAKNSTEHYVNPSDRKRWLALLEKNGVVYNFDTRLYRYDGTIIWTRNNGRVIKDKKGKMLHIEGAMLDITKRKRDKEALKKTRRYLKNIIDSMPSVLVGIDKEGFVNQWNLEAEKRTGLQAKQAEGLPLGKAYPRLLDQMEQIQQVMKDKRPRKVEKVLSEIDGETQYSEIVIYPLLVSGVEGAVLRIDDVTARVRLEDMMVQTEKMMTVGGLAAGMAHEINNPLSGILQGAQNLARRFSPDLAKNVATAEACGIDLELVNVYMGKRQIFKFLEGIRESSLRASKIVANMLQFSRRSESNIEYIDPVALVNKTVELALNDYDLKKQYDFKQIKIVRDFDTEQAKVPCVSTEIQQVIFNLIKNATQAIHKAERTGSPTLFLRLRKGRREVRFEVEDNGPGIDEKTQRRVFDPFFTTKKVGVGTGLGLYVSYFIITEKHKGKMMVESNPGKGANFIFHLPL